MTDTTEGAPGAGEPQPIAAHVAGGDGTLTARDAARSLIDWRRKTAAGETQPIQQEPSADPATPAHESAPQADADPGTGEPRAPGEDPAIDPAAELPPIEPPRSWTKDEKERFATLPRETQEYLAARETERDREFRTRQNEQAEARKAFDAEQAAVGQARQQYEQALQMVYGQLQEAYAGAFPDIKTMEDVQRLATEDPLRYSQWDAQQKRIAAVAQEVTAANQRAYEEAHARFNEFKAREIARFTESAPEMADEGKRKALMTSAEAVLRDVKFTDQELAQLWHGQNALSIHDHRFQLILRDAVRWRDAEAARKKAAADLAAKKPSLPPVLRPGAAPDKGAAHQALLKQLDANLDKTTGNAALRAAAALTLARRRA